MLRAKYPFLDHDRLAATPITGSAQDLVTVDLLTRLVAHAVSTARGGFIH